MEEMKMLNDEELEKVIGGAASHEELLAMAHTCPFCHSSNVTGGVGGNL